jgi:hypothetical protein
MPFDETKDAVLDSQVAIADSKTRILAQVCSYDGGSKKLQLKRENFSKGDWTFAKLGRMTPNEFRELVPVALEVLERNGL